MWQPGDEQPSEEAIGPNRKERFEAVLESFLEAWDELVKEHRLACHSHGKAAVDAVATRDILDYEKRRLLNRFVEMTDPKFR